LKTMEKKLNSPEQNKNEYKYQQPPVSPSEMSDMVRSAARYKNKKCHSATILKSSNTNDGIPSGVSDINARQNRPMK